MFKLWVDFGREIEWTNRWYLGREEWIPIVWFVEIDVLVGGVTYSVLVWALKFRLSVILMVNDCM